MIFFIFSRVLFVASMVFIMGYLFGWFRHSPTLTTITKVASILVVVLYVGMNVSVGRIAARNGFRPPAGYGCQYQPTDSTIHR